MNLLQQVFENIVYNGLESLGRYYSSYRGYVIDNEDPDNMSRVKVRIPAITRKNDHPVWAYPKNSFAGKDYGMQLLPQKGDIVWVEFEHGDPKFPLWTHAHFTKGQKPSEFSTPQIYGFKTPKGQLIIIDDRDGVEKIIVKSLNHFIIDSDVVAFEADQIFLKGEIVGTPRFLVGANGSFATLDGQYVTVTNGLITSID